jgi:hypothetical protein
VSYEGGCAPHIREWDVGTTTRDVEARKGRTSLMRGPHKFKVKIKV